MDLLVFLLIFLAVRLYIFPTFATTPKFSCKSELESELNDFINNTDTFSIECPNNISENVEKKILINKIDLQGRMLLENSPGIIIYIYSDGSIEKQLLLKKM